ncbi:MAG: sulfatase-like hydrolase/transferase [Maioricimonas sp. JB049]
MLRVFLLLLVCLSGLLRAAQGQADDARPNILWITSEDNGPHLGCYGDEYATTPHLDALAKRSLLYRNCWSNAPVCAPARTTIITGVYPPATGSQHMRSMVRMPDFMRMYPQILREAGYYCTNNSKEDYNLAKPGDVWHESSRRGHWKNRRPGQPFFAIFNHTVSHESQLRKRPHEAVHDPAGVRVPAYHPDTPEVRQDWAQYYDKLTEMDRLVGRNLKELEEAGLADETIVMYYGDHGSGMPRSKRWPYNSGLHVPLIVHIPEKYAHLRPEDYRAGGSTERLVSFVDLAPTLLSLAGIEAPEWMQGHAFAGVHEAEPQPYLYGYRGRMDERYDLVRSVRNQRYVYLRHYMPHKIYGQYIQYMFQTPTTQVWRQRFEDGTLTPEQALFWQEKPTEELYDLKTDPDEVRNLADSAEHEKILDELRQAHREWVFRIRDVGFLPEAELHGRAEGSTPYEVGHDPSGYPLEKIFAAAQLAAGRDRDAISELRGLLDSDESGVRYWGAMGLLIRKEDGVNQGRRALRSALEDSSPSVQVAAGEALACYGNPEDVDLALPVLLKNANLEESGLYVAMQALNAIDAADEKAAPIRDEIAALPHEAPSYDRRLRSYVPNLIKKILADLGE